MRPELDEHDLFSGDHKGSLCKIDMDKSGPHLLSVWGQLLVHVVEGSCSNLPHKEQPESELNLLKLLTGH